MPVRHALATVLFGLVLASGSLFAAEQVPFRGVWSGSTVSAEPQEDPNLVLVVSSGPGQATHLGRFTMESPHITNMTDLTVEGDQIFTAANGDKVFATFSGQFTPTPEGTLDAMLSAVIIGGTGRFAGASGSYDFLITARPAASGFGFDSTAMIAGTISSPGSLK